MAVMYWSIVFSRGQVLTLADTAEFLSGGLILAQLIVSPGQLCPGAGVIGILGQHALQGKDGLGSATRIQGRYAQQQIVFDIPAACLKMLDQPLIGLFGLVVLQ